MAKVAQRPELREWIDDYLEYLCDEWRDVPQVVREWHEWEDHVQLEFLCEWPIREDRLHQLEQWAEQGLLTPDQDTRYQQLLGLVAAYRPVLEDLLKD